MKQIQLPNECRCSQLAVYPTNWKTVRASTKNIWYIKYRFYDPTNEQYKYGYQVEIRGMNKFSELKVRQQATQELINNELDMLVNRAFNPITKQCIQEEQIQYEIDPSTPFLIALDKALERIKYTTETKRDVKSILKYFGKSVKQLRFETIGVYDVRKKHVRLALDNCAKIKKIWNEHQFNHYRKYLSSLFNQLCELEAVEHNIVHDIAKKAEVKKLRKVLGPEERKTINDYLKETNYSFYRFINIFFHSGSRLNELCRLKTEDVDLHNQQFKITIIKGKNKREVIKPIKDIALSFWEEIMSLTTPGDYVFGKGLIPNKIPTCGHQLTRRWRVHIKQKLGIDADLYSLKHLNTTETVDLLNEAAAAKMNSHTSQAMVVSIYDVNQVSRKNEQLRKVNNPL